MLWPKKNSCKKFDNEKKFLRHNFSNGPSLMRNKKTCLQHDLKMCSLKQIQTVPIKNVCIIQQLKVHKSANLRSHLSSLLTYEKNISCEYVNYFLIPGNPTLLYIHYNMLVIGHNEIISRFARLHPRRMELANILSA